MVSIHPFVKSIITEDLECLSWIWAHAVVVVVVVAYPLRHLLSHRGWFHIVGLWSSVIKAFILKISIRLLMLSGCCVLHIRVVNRTTLHVRYVCHDGNPWNYLVFSLVVFVTSYWSASDHQLWSVMTVFFCILGFWGAVFHLHLYRM